MSYILDALKKADQQRQHAAAPTLRSAPQAVLDTRKPTTGRYAALIFIVVGVILLVGWLWFSHSTERTQPAPAVAVATPTPTTPASPPVVPALPAPPLPLPETAVAKPAPHAPTVAAPVPTVETPAPAAEPAQAHVLTMDELPLPVRESLPAMTISLHAWSATPKARMVSINNRLLHEGDSPAEGVVLEEIAPDGMILSFRGYRFRHGVK